MGKFNLGTDHPLVKARDRAALAMWAIDQAAGDFRYFAYLAVALWAQLDTLATYGFGEYWWVAIILTGIAAAVFVTAYHLARMPREQSRQSAVRKANYMHPQRAIMAIIEGGQKDAFLRKLIEILRAWRNGEPIPDHDDEIEMYTRREINRFVRGIDMETLTVTGTGEIDQVPKRN